MKSNILDKEIEQIIEANLFLDSKQKLVDFYGERQYQFLLSEIFEYCVLNSNETVLNSLLGKANYLIGKFDQKDALYKITKDLAKLYVSGFFSKDLLRLAKNKNKVFDLELERLKGVSFRKYNSITEPQGKIFESELSLTDIEIEQVFILQQRKYWRDKFSMIDQEIESELDEVFTISGSFFASYSYKDVEPINLTMEERYSIDDMPEIKPQKSNKTKIIFIAVSLLLIVLLFWYFFSN
jgi:hypothetical protein